MPEPDKNFDTGAVRSNDLENLRFDLIHPIALIALARTYGEGAKKYGDFNWERGMPASSLLNHAIRHIYLFLSGDRSEPHLPHAAWGVMAAIVSMELWPELNHGTLRGCGCTIDDHVAHMQLQLDQELAEYRRSEQAVQDSRWAPCDLADVDRIVYQGGVKKSDATNPF
jgi:hypothetical protein